MTEPVYFVIERVHGRLSPSLITERLPAKFTGNRAHENGLVYQERIDDKPHFAECSTQALLAMWQANRRKLPAAPVALAAPLTPPAGRYIRLRAPNPVWPT